MAPEYEFYEPNDNYELILRRLQATQNEHNRNRDINDMHVAHRIIEMLRGRRLSKQAYAMIRIEIDHCYYDHNDIGYREREREMKIRWMERMEHEHNIRVPPERYKIILDELTPKEFIEEKDMKL